MKRLALLNIALLIGCSITFSREIVDLAGRWNVKLESDSVIHGINLPGTTDEAGLGEPDTLSLALRRPQLSHLTRRHRFVGNPTYSRTVDIPGTMANKPLRLTLGRVLWSSRLSVDGRPMSGVGESLVAPHVFDIPNGLTAGPHTFTLDIDNSKRYEVSTANLAHCYTDDTQIMWNGVLGDLTLEVVDDVDIESVQVYPDVDASAADVVMTVANNSGKAVKEKFRWSITGMPGKSLSGSFKATIAPGDNNVEFKIADASLAKCLWSEFSPIILNLKVETSRHESSRAVDFGMRSFTSDGKRLLINGRPVFLRGTLECCVFPLTGRPPMDETGWEPVFKAARAWGLNHLRFHSWCPPDAAFRVADRMGFYLQVECPLLATDIQSGTDGANGDVKRFIKDEFDRISRNYGNHPSLCMMTVGNELQHDFDWLNEMTAHMHATDPRHLYAATSFTFEKGHGGHAEPNDDFLVTQWTDDGWVRGQGVFDSEPPAFDRDYASATKDLTVPLVAHEIGQYAVYPDLREIDRYTGVLDPVNFKSIKADLEAKGRLDRADDYLNASGKLAAILYKEEIERAMRTPGFSGIQLLGLQDFPGQGTALIGLVNAFWDSKGIVEPSWFKQFCGPIVPLARFPKAVYTGGEIFSADIDFTNYSLSDTLCSPSWTLSEGNCVIESGTFDPVKLLAGVNRIGHINVTLPVIDRSRKLELTVSDPSLGANNTWSVWVYPPDNDDVDFGDIVVTGDAEVARKALDEGRDVLYSPDRHEIDGLKTRFVPVFWSPVHFPDQAGGMGLLCDPSHPALADFTTDGHTDWQWWHILKNSRTLDLSNCTGASPIIEAVDNFTNNRQLALLFEARCGNGRLIFSAIDLLNNSADDPATCQLLRSVINYMKSGKFNPVTEVDESVFDKFSL